MGKLDKVIAALESCTSGMCRGNCPYDGDGYCKDRLMRDALSFLKVQDKALKSMYKRQSVTLIERDTIREKLIQTREEVMDLRKDIARMTGERWDVPPFPTNGEETVPEFPREGM